LPPISSDLRRSLPQDVAEAIRGNSNSVSRIQPTQEKSPCIAYEVSAGKVRSGWTMISLSAAFREVHGFASPSWAFFVEFFLHR
jgi:hypothetical protein